MLAAGATRIGASASVKILREASGETPRAGGGLTAASPKARMDAA